MGSIKLSLHVNSFRHSCKVMPVLMSLAFFNLFPCKEKEKEEEEEEEGGG